MYTPLLLLSILAVVLSPVLLDLFLSFREAQLDVHVLRSKQTKGPRSAWAFRRVH